MTDKEMLQYIGENHDKAEKYAYFAYRQWQRAESITNAIEEDIEEGSPSAATDQVIFTIGAECYSISLSDADSVDAAIEFLHKIKELAVEEIKDALEMPR